MFDSLTRLALGHAKAVLVGAVVFFVIAGSFGGSLAGLLKPSDGFMDPGSESAQANIRFEEIANSRAAPGVLILVQTPTGARSPEGRERVHDVHVRAARDEGVARVSDFRQADKDEAKARKRGDNFNESSFVSKDGKETYVAVYGYPDADEAKIGNRLGQAFAGDPWIKIGGPGPAGDAIGQQVIADLGSAERIAFPLLFVLMLFVFRGLVAAMLPLVVGILTIVGTMSLLRLINAPVPLSIFALNLSIALGLGLAIDYSLFVVSRYREELARGLEPRLAIIQTIHTSGRTVLFSSLTVAAALASLMVFPQQFLYSMAIAGSITALLASGISLIVLPALLLVLGHRVNSFAPKRWQRPEEKLDTGFWFRLSRWVMKRSVIVAICASAFLIILGLPFLRIQFTGIDARVLPEGNVPREVDSILRKDFTTADTEPIAVIVNSLPDAPKNKKAIDQYADDIAKLKDVKNVTTPQYLSPWETWAFNVTSEAPVLDKRSQTLITNIRGVEQPGPAMVTGQTARFVDQQKAIAAGLPFALFILGGATLVILFLMTGSVLLPIKSLLMNALALSAAFGCLVLIFQDGRFQNVLGYETQGGLESTQPLLLLALAFGLSTDYGVFLLTRIKEGHDAGMSNEDAVAVGLQRTGKIITAAALLFCVAIGAFATSKIIFIKEVGVGTALAVLIDATIVRALLVPALMKLLGEWNWWAPPRLRRLHDRLGIDEGAPPIPIDREIIVTTPPAPLANTPPNLSPW